LSDILKTLLGLEREAFDLNTAEEKPEDSQDSVVKTLSDLYQSISGRSRGLPGLALPAPGSADQSDEA